MLRPLLQGEIGSPADLSFTHDLTNAAMASVPGHKIWLHVFRVLRSRAGHAIAGSPIHTTGTFKGH